MNFATDYKIEKYHHLTEFFSFPGRQDPDWSLPRHLLPDGGGDRPLWEGGGVLLPRLEGGRPRAGQRVRAGHGALWRIRPGRQGQVGVVRPLQGDQHVRLAQDWDRGVRDEEEGGGIRRKTESSTHCFRRKSIFFLILICSISVALKLFWEGKNTLNFRIFWLEKNNPQIKTYRKYCRSIHFILFRPRPSFPGTPRCFAWMPLNGTASAPIPALWS